MLLGVAAGVAAAVASGGTSAAADQLNPLALRPVADAQVSARHPNRNFGRTALLRLSASPRQRVYLRFDLRRLGGKVKRATLVLPVRKAKAGQGAVGRAVGGWKEGKLTYRRAPRILTTRVVRFRRGATSLTADVTSLAKAGRLVDIGLMARTGSVTFASREGARAKAPRLVLQTTGVVVAVGPPPPPTPPPAPPPPPPQPPPGGYPVIAAAGDIACDPADQNVNGNATRCHQRAVSDLLVQGGLAAVLPLGDNQYACGSAQAFSQVYDPTWGRVKSITHPAVGNHEYLNVKDPLTTANTGCDGSNTGAAGYFGYFGAAAGQRGQGYYSYDVGSWHLIALNTNCQFVPGATCKAGSAEVQWLAADLAAHKNLCTLAYFHHPRFSSGGRADPTATSAIWNTLYASGADVVLTGHDHIYERFAPQNGAGGADPARGIREFVVGTGGSNHTVVGPIAANSEVQNMDTFGVLKLTLRPNGYDWQFVPDTPGSFTDSGSGACH